MGALGAIGMVAVNELLKEGSLQAALDSRSAPTKLTILLGNPLAVILNQRFIDKNLNRIMGQVT